MSSRRRSRSNANCSNLDLKSLLSSEAGNISCMDVCKEFGETTFWFYLILSLVFAYWAYKYYVNALDFEYFENLNSKPNWGPTEHALVIINLAFYLIFGISGNVNHKNNGFNIHHIILFLMASALNVLYPWVFLEKQRPDIAFWVLLLQLIICIYWMTSSGSSSMMLMLGLYCFWLIYMLVWQYRVATKNPPGNRTNGIYFWRDIKIVP